MKSKSEDYATTGISKPPNQTKHHPNKRPPITIFFTPSNVSSLCVATMPCPPALCINAMQIQPHFIPSQNQANILRQTQSSYLSGSSVHSLRPQCNRTLQTQRSDTRPITSITPTPTPGMRSRGRLHQSQISRTMFRRIRRTHRNIICGQSISRSRWRNSRSSDSSIV